MASTLGVLDVLTRLREESERASVALKLQEGINRELLERCIDAEAESGRAGDVKVALRLQKRQLEEGRRAAETTQQEAERRLGRLQKKQAARKEAAQRMRKATIAAARSAVDSSKKFRADASESMRQIRELRARLREKKTELDSAREEDKELKHEMDSRRATRDKLKAEVASREESVAAACSKADDIDRENKSTLARVKHVESKIDEIQHAKDEMQEMAVGLQRKNAILRNELRHLKREFDGNLASHARRISSHESNNERGDGTMIEGGGNTRPTSARSGVNVRNESRKRTGNNGGNFYLHSTAPRQSDGRRSTGTMPPPPPTRPYWSPPARTPTRRSGGRSSQRLPSWECRSYVLVVPIREGGRPATKGSRRYRCRCRSTARPEQIMREKADTRCCKCWR